MALTTIPFAGDSLEFEPLAPIDTGQRKALQLNAQVGPDSGPGTITNRALAVGGKPVRVVGSHQERPARQVHQSGVCAGVGPGRARPR